jgi:formate/nitrite transporter
MLNSHWPVIFLHFGDFEQRSMQKLKKLSHLGAIRWNSQKVIVPLKTFDPVSFPKPVQFVDTHRDITHHIDTPMAESLKSPAATMQSLEEVAQYKVNRSNAKIFSSSVLGGALLGFGGMIYLGISSVAVSPIAPMVGALFFPIGLLTIIFTGSDLLTGNFMYGALPFLSKKSPKTEGKLVERSNAYEVGRLLMVSLAGNLVGAIIMAAVASVVMPASLPWASVAAMVAAKKVHLAFGVAFLKGICANWLVNLAIYMSTASTSASGKILGLWIPIATFVALQFEHSVANMFLIPLGIFVGGDITWIEFLVNNMIPVIAGNAVGGALCVSFWQTWNSAAFQQKAPTLKSLNPKTIDSIHKEPQPME